MDIKSPITGYSHLTIGENGLVSPAIHSTFEYDGTSLYFTGVGGYYNRKALSFGSTYYANTIHNQGRVSSNVGQSVKGSKGYWTRTPNGDDLANGQNASYTGTITNTNTFNITTNPNFTVNQLKEYPASIGNSTYTQRIKVKSNTAQTVTFYEPILLSFGDTFVTHWADPGNQTWTFDNTYIDTGFTGGSFIDAVFDGLYLWLLPADTESVLYKVNTITKEVHTIAHGVTPSLCRKLMLDERFIWILNSGADHIKINIDTEIAVNIANSILDPTFLIFKNRILSVLGKDAENFNANSIKNYYPDISTNLLGTIDISVMLPNTNTIQDTLVVDNIDNAFIISSNLNTGTTVSIWSLDPNFNISLLHNITEGGTLHSSSFDGSFLWINIQTQFFFKTVKWNPYDPTSAPLYVGETLSGSNEYKSPLVFSGEMFHTYRTNSGLNYGWIQSRKPNDWTLYPNTSFYGEIAASKMPQSYNLLCSDDLIFLWGGRYICKEYLPNSKRTNIGFDKNTTMFENGIQKKWKNISSNYAVDKRDYGLLIDSSVARTITLLPPSLAKNQEFVFKDDTGLASTNNITISGSIEGNGSVVISTDYGKIKLMSNGSSYRII